MGSFTFDNVLMNTGTQVHKDGLTYLWDYDDFARSPSMCRGAQRSRPHRLVVW